MKRILIGAAVAALAVLAIPKPAGADTIPYCGTCHAVFNDSAQTVTLTIPSGNGRWLLFVDEPDVTGQPVVGSSAAPVGANGSYTLTVDYPTCWKGTIQGDSEVWNADKGVWHYVVGFKHAVDTTLSCPASTTTTQPSTTTTMGGGTTTTVAPSTTTTQMSTTTTTQPKQVTPGVPPKTPPAPPVTQVSPAPGAPMQPVSVATPAAQLPFTGFNAVPYLLVGGSLVSLGLWTLWAADRKRWALRRAAVARFGR